MLAYRLIRSSSLRDPPPEWADLPVTTGQGSPVDFSRYQDGLWSAQTVGSSPSDGEVYNIVTPGPQHFVQIEERQVLGDFVDRWRISFSTPIGVFRLEASGHLGAGEGGGDGPAGGTHKLAISIMK